MDDNGATEIDTFVRMARDFPVRTGLFTFGLPMFAFLQLLNGVVHGGSLLFMAGFVVLTMVCSVLLAQYQLSVYRRERLSRQWL